MSKILLQTFSLVMCFSVLNFTVLAGQITCGSAEKICNNGDNCQSTMSRTQPSRTWLTPVEEAIKACTPNDPQEESCKRLIDVFRKFGDCI